MISDKEFKSPLKFPGSGYEMVTCHYPLRLDVYSGWIYFLSDQAMCLCFIKKLAKYSRFSGLEHCL
jgi:hypothetical protein